MRIVFGRPPEGYVFAVQGSIPPPDPTPEQRERMRRMAENYDEAEHERIVRMAFPARPPGSS